MTRAFIIVLDSLGVGGAPDAAAYGDEGSDTLGHIAARCAAGDADRSGVRHGNLRIPNMAALGMSECMRVATGRHVTGIEASDWIGGSAGCAAECSTGKDSQSGHWEMSGAPVDFDWGYFPRTAPCFPETLIDELCTRCSLPGILGNRHASGTEIIADLGEEHMRSNRPICYTSADSVFQIAAHEMTFGLERLYAVCEVARKLVDPLRIGRVIARPFVGIHSADFKRTAGRKDYGVAPPSSTLLRRARDLGRDVVSVGKIGDLFNHDATGLELKAPDNAGVFEQMLGGMERVGEGGLLFANFVDFDMLYGHRRDVAGYAHALEELDRELPRFLERLSLGDLAIITGDHGCDPSWSGSDHTRECVPILAFGLGVRRASLGRRHTFADIGATIARHLRLQPVECGCPFDDGGD